MAVIDCVYGDAPPPSELSLSWQCERWHTLPDVGGLWQQDYLTMKRMTITANVYNAVSRLPNANQLTDSDRRIIRMLMDNGISVT